MIIPTRCRFRIAKALAYPVGAEAISLALEGVPQFASLSLRFMEGTGRSPDPIRRKVESGEPLIVFDARYRNVKPGLTGSNAHIASGWYSERWSLWVYPVLAAHKKTVARSLTEHGLAAVHDWLAQPRSESWRHQRKWLTLFFESKRARLRAVEGGDL